MRMCMDVYMLYKDGLCVHEDGFRECENAVTFDIIKGGGVKSTGGG